MKKQLGFNFFFQLDGKNVGGETQSDLSISATEKSSLTKADKGNAQTEVSGHEVTANISGVSVVNEDGSTEVLDADILMEQSLKVGAESVIPFVYTRGEAKAYKGNCVITSYSESTNAEGEATWSLSIKVSGAMTPVA
jgi:hypothetical protein